MICGQSGGRDVQRLTVADSSGLMARGLLRWPVMTRWVVLSLVFCACTTEVTNVYESGGASTVDTQPTSSGGATSASSSTARGGSTAAATTVTAVATGGVSVSSSTTTSTGGTSATSAITSTGGSSSVVGTTAIGGSVSGGTTSTGGTRSIGGSSAVTGGTSSIALETCLYDPNRPLLGTCSVATKGQQMCIGGKCDFDRAENGDMSMRLDCDHDGIADTSSTTFENCGECGAKCLSFQNCKTNGYHEWWSCQDK